MARLGYSCHDCCVGSLLGGGRQSRHEYGLQKQIWPSKAHCLLQCIAWHPEARCKTGRPCAVRWLRILAAMMADERTASAHKNILECISKVLITLESLSKMLQVPLALIEGRVPFILWPPSRAGWVKSRMPPGRLLVKNDEALNDPRRFGAS